MLIRPRGNTNRHGITIRVRPAETIRETDIVTEAESRKHGIHEKQLFGASIEVEKVRFFE